MTRLDDLFLIKAGLVSSRVTVSNTKTKSSIAYLRPAKTQQRTLAGWVERSSVPSEHRHPIYTLFVSTDGEGSHTYAYVSTFEFVANSNVCVLLPKREMSLAEKIFYAKAITLNRGKFSYGRKPKGERLKSIELPNTPPDWVKNPIDFDSTFGGLPNFPVKAIQRRHLKAGTSTVSLCELFEVNYGTNLELNAMDVNPHGINFVARTSQNNGVSAKVQKLSEMEPTEGGVLSVAGGGSVLETFLQVEPFYSGRDLFYLRPKTKMSVDVMLFYATCIKANRYKYSYGRQANKTLRDLKLPAIECVPAWVNGAFERVSVKIKVLTAETLQAVILAPSDKFIGDGVDLAEWIAEGRA
ncbi:restriction endonuclease [Limnohabitans sp. HM2-2]|jgi:hypothetical protein|uniref:Restriction endonuclease n=2 Tax=Limnohabitans lacus TaxID=3045173 RepID=A0ABT6X638_9BURK|nr:restriction endonuclease [Limnohabitans sp. HM2-2]